MDGLDPAACGVFLGFVVIVEEVRGAVRGLSVSLGGGGGGGGGGKYRVSSGRDIAPVFAGPCLFIIISGGVLFLVEVSVGVVLRPKVKMGRLVRIGVESRAVSGSALKLFFVGHEAVLLHPGKVTYQLLICDE